jgi:hypothetical protein
MCPGQAVTWQTFGSDPPIAELVAGWGGEDPASAPAAAGRYSYLSARTGSIFVARRAGM